MLGGLTSLLGGLGSTLRGVDDAVSNVAETLSPGSTAGNTTTGNLIGNNGATDDLITGLETGDLTGAVQDIYGNLIGSGGVVHNLGDGGGLGIEGLVGNVLGTADGFLGVGDGLLDGVVGGGDGLLG